MDKEGISEDELRNLEKDLADFNSKIEDIPHIILATVPVEGHSKQWVHNNIAASSKDIMAMFAHLFTHDSRLMVLVEGAIKWAKSQSNNNTPPTKGALGELLSKLIQENLDKLKTPANPKFLDSLEKEVQESTGSTFDVDELIKSLWSKKDDEEGDKSE